MEREVLSYSWSTPSPNYVDCPHAEWSLKCPHVGTKECKECPIYKARTLPEPPVYVFPKHTNRTVNGGGWKFED